MAGPLKIVVEFPEMVLFVMVMVPPLAIPPPVSLAIL